MCADGAPCTNIHIRDFAMWTDSGGSVSYQCQSAYGTGACLKSGNGGAYPAVKQTISSPPSSYKAPRMPWDLKQSFGTTTFIPIPEIPDYFFPGTKPIKALVRGGGGGRSAPSSSSRENQIGPREAGYSTRDRDSGSPRRDRSTALPRAQNSISAHDRSSSSPIEEVSGSHRGDRSSLLGASFWSW
jgi:rhamnogalacturonan hydrolase